jgi:tRNA threonylcarbamoyladenosine biosynthesis protein TsaE
VRRQPRPTPPANLAELPDVTASHRTESAEQTEALGASVAERLRPGDVVVLRGEVGAGKTTFVRGAARALGITGAITSPTFTIGRRYGRIGHVDLHRIGSLADEEPELLDDYLGPDLISFVEWPDAAGDEVEPRVRVEIAHAGGDAREVAIEWLDPPAEPSRPEAAGR